MNKKIKYLLMFFVCFSLFIPKTNAIKFYWNDRIYFKKSLGFSSSKSSTYNHGSLIKKYSNAKISGADSYGYAYCADREQDFKTGEAYTRDKTYKDKKCYYQQYNKNTKKWEKTSTASGDCSKIIGYIIKHGRAKGSTQFKDYGYTQSAIWVFLGKFANDSTWKAHNDKNVNYAYNNNSTIRSILHEAFKEYDKKKNAKEEYDEIELNDPLFSISNNNEILYFMPKEDTDECGSEGAKYRSRTKTIENISGETIYATFTAKNTGYNIIIKDMSNNEKCKDKSECEITIAKNQKYKFYLETTTLQNIGEVQLEISAHIKPQSDSETVTVYDSVKYKRTNTSYQGLIIGTKETVKKSELVTNTYTKTLNFHQDMVSTKTAKNTTSVTDADGKCANENPDNYTVNLNKNICKTVNIGNGNKVRVILGEAVSFQYGNLIPSDYEEKFDTTVFAGGPFKLNTKTELGKTSKYTAVISWKFADYKNGDPYYYNSKVNEDDGQVIYTKANTDNIINKINNAMLNEGSKSIKTKLTNLDLEIETYDSNTLNNGSAKIAAYDPVYKINILKDSTKVMVNGVETTDLEFKATDTTKKQYKLKINATGIQVKKYAKENKINRVVRYLDHTKSEYSETTKRAYFTPMYFPTGDFIFNIKRTNISLVDNINLYYNAKCSIKVENRFKQENLRYRSIELEDLFPKATKNEELPLNWQEWYQQQENITRIKDTLTKEPIYRIDLTKEKIKTIDEINKASAYTEWKNIDMNGNGNSLIIKPDLFEKYASTSSYCKIGEFKENCDNYNR